MQKVSTRFLPNRSLFLKQLNLELDYEEGVGNLLEEKDVLALRKLEEKAKERMEQYKRDRLKDDGYRPEGSLPIPLGKVLAEFTF